MESTIKYGERVGAFLNDHAFEVGGNRPKNNPKKPHNRSLNAVNGPMSDS